MAPSIEASTTPVVGVLGPTTWAGGDQQPFALRPRERDVLAVLALHHPAPVSRAVLIDLVWAGQPPPTAGTALRNHLARLRSALGGAIVGGGATGHRLGAGVTTDIALFADCRRQAASATRPEERVDALRRALSLWRGQPFEDLHDGPAVAAARQSLIEGYCQAEEEQADALLDAGASGEAAETLEALVADQPFRERRWELLLVARYRMGDRRAALLVVARARQALAEAGIGLGPRLRQLERAALEDDPSLGLAVAPAPAAPVPEVQATFVGRADEERQVRAAAAQGRDSSQPAVLYGEAGIGKSGLLDRLVRAEEAAGRLVLRAAGDPRPPTPLAAWQAVLDQLAAAGVHPDPVLERALRGPSLPVPPLGAPLSSAQDRIVAVVLDALGRAAAAHDTLLVFDDVQLAPPSTRRLLAELVAAALPVAVVVAGRATAADLVLPLLGSPTGAEPISLAGLDRREVAEYLRIHAPGADMALASWLQAQTGGNPLLLAHAVGALAARGPDAWQGEPGQDLAGLWERLLGLRLRELSASSIEVLRVASVFGQRCRLVELQGAAGPSAAAISELTHAGLLVPSADGAELRFAHQLIQEATYRGLTAGHRAELHEAAALTVATGTVDASARVHAVAHHRLALAATDPVEAVRAGQASAEAYLAAYAFEDAAERFAAAESVARSSGLAASVACGLAAAGGDALRQAGDPASVDVLTRAAAEAETLGEHDLLARCALGLCRLGPTSAAGTSDEVATAVADRALATIGDAGLRAEVAGAASLLHSMDGDPARCRTLYEEGEALARRHGDPGVLSRVLPYAYLALNHPDDLDRTAALSAELATLAEESGDLPSAWEAALLRYSVTLQHGEAGIDEIVDRMEELSTAIGEPSREWQTAYLFAARDHLHGRFDEAERRINDTLRFTRSVAASRVEAIWGALILTIRVDQGRAGELADTLAALVATQPLVPGWRAAMTHVAASGGDLAMARQALDSFRVDGCLQLPMDFSWSALGMMLARGAAALGDRGACAELTALLAPIAGRLTWAGFATFGPTDTALGLLAEALGERDRARAHWKVAAALSARVGASALEAEAEGLLARI